MQCLVLFAVKIRVQRTLLTSTKVWLGQNVFPLTSLKPGERVSHNYIRLLYEWWYFIKCTFQVFSNSMRQGRPDASHSHD